MLHQVGKLYICSNKSTQLVMDNINEIRIVSPKEIVVTAEMASRHGISLERLVIRMQKATYIEVSRYTDPSMGECVEMVKRERRSN